MVSSLGKNLFKRYEDQRVGRGGGEGHRIGLKGIGIPFSDYIQTSATVPHPADRRHPRGALRADGGGLGLREH